MNIIEPTTEFDFNSLHLGPLIPLANGYYFTRLFSNKNILYTQCPKCCTKNGIIVAGTKQYADLVFDNTECDFAYWIESLETKCQELIIQSGNANNWFQEPMTQQDIESIFVSPIKSFKSGKKYSIRANVKPSVKIYNKLKEECAFETAGDNEMLVTIVEVQGIKFSLRNFQIEFEVKQIMIIAPDPFSDECVINLNIHQKMNLEEENKLEENKLEENKLEENKLEETKEHYEEINKDLGENIESVEEYDKLIEDEGYYDEKIIEEKIIEDINDNEDINEELEEKIVPDNTNILFDNDNKDNEDQSITLDNLVEVNLDTTLDNTSSLETKIPNTLTLTPASEIYRNMYNTAKSDAKLSKKNAYEAYANLMRIKQTYFINDDSDSDFEDNHVNVRIHIDEN